MSDYPVREGNNNQNHSNKDNIVNRPTAATSSTRYSIESTTSGLLSSPSSRPSISDYYHYQYQSSPGGSLTLLKRASLPRPSISHTNTNTSVTSSNINKMDGSTLLLQHPQANNSNVGFFETGNNMNNINSLSHHIMYNNNSSGGSISGGSGLTPSAVAAGGSAGAYAAYAYGIGSPSAGLAGIGTPGGEYFPDGVAGGHSGFTPTGSLSGPSGGGWFGPELLPGSSEELGTWSPASNGYRTSSLSGSFSGPVLMPYSLVPGDEHKPQQVQVQHQQHQQQHSQAPTPQPQSQHAQQPPHHVQGQSHLSQSHSQQPSQQQVVQGQAQAQAHSHSQSQSQNQAQNQSQNQSHSQGLQHHVSQDMDGSHLSHPNLHPGLSQPDPTAAAVTAADTGASGAPLHVYYNTPQHQQHHGMVPHGNMLHTAAPGAISGVIPGNLPGGPGGLHHHGMSSPAVKSESPNTSSNMDGDNPAGLSKKYQCHICGKYYRRDLPRHLRTHQEVARFTCPFPKEGCPHKRGMFNRPYDFKKHLLHGHFVFDENKAVRSFRDLHSKLSRAGTCGCGRRFTASDWLDNHVFGTDDPCPLLVRNAVDNLKGSLELQRH